MGMSSARRAALQPALSERGPGPDSAAAAAPRAGCRAGALWLSAGARSAATRRGVSQREAGVPAVPARGLVPATQAAAEAGEWPPRAETGGTAPAGVLELGLHERQSGGWSALP